MAAFNWRTQSGQEYTDEELLRAENPDEFYRMMAFQAGQRESLGEQEEEDTQYQDPGAQGRGGYLEGVESLGPGPGINRPPYRPDARPLAGTPPGALPPGQAEGPPPIPDNAFEEPSERTGGPGGNENPPGSEAAAAAAAAAVGVAGDDDGTREKLRQTAIDEFGPDQRLAEYLRGRGLDENSMMYVMLRDMLRNQAYAARPLFTAHTDSLGLKGEEGQRHKEDNYGDFFNRMMGDVGYRRDVSRDARRYLGSGDPMGKGTMLGKTLDGFQTNQQRQEYLETIEEAMLRASLPRWMASSLAPGSRNQVGGSYARKLIDDAAPTGEMESYFSPWTSNFGIR